MHIMRSGWFKAVKDKSFTSIRSDVVNQMRGCLPIFGISIKGISGIGFEKRVLESIDERDTLAAPLQVQLTVLQIIKKQIDKLDELLLTKETPYEILKEKLL